MIKSALHLLTLAIIVLVGAPIQGHAQTSADFSAGGVIVGADTDACDGDKEGAIRWSSASSCTEYCDGSDWICPRSCESPSDPVWVTASGTIDTVNENIGVYAQLDATDEVGTPNFQKISGDSWINVSSTGVVSGKATGGTGTFPVTVRVTDCQGNSADRSFDVVVNAWSGPAGCTDPGDVCPDGTVYAGLTPDGDVDFFVTQQNQGSFPFNDGTQNWIDSAVPNCSNGGTEAVCRTGESNTNSLVITDSASTTPGTDPHNSALACFCLGETHTNAPDGVVPPQCSGDPVGTNALEGHGYDDWYLPAIAEMDVIYVNLVSPTDTDNPTYADGASGGDLDAPNDGPQAPIFGAHEYANSSERNTFWANYIDFNEGRYYATNKEQSERVRCARK